MLRLLNCYLTATNLALEIMTASHPPAIPDPRTDAVWDGPEPKKHRTVIEHANDCFIRIYDEEQCEDDGPICAWIEGEAYEI